MAIEILPVYASQDIGVPENPAMPNATYFSVTPQPSAAVPLKFYRLSGWIVFPAGGFYQVSLLINFSGFVRIDGTTIGSGGLGALTLSDYYVPGPAVLRIDLSYSTLTPGDSGYVAARVLDADGNIIFSPTAADFTGFSADNINEWIDDSALPEEPPEPEPPVGPPPPPLDPWDGSLSTVYGTENYRTAEIIQTTALHLTEDPGAMSTALPYNYLMAKWLILPRAGVYRIDVAGGSGPYRLKINDDQIAAGAVDSVASGVFTVTEPTVVRLDLSYRAVLTQAVPQVPGYIGYTVTDNLGMVIDRSNPLDFVGAITPSASDRIPDEALGSMPDIPPEDDPRLDPADPASTNLEVFPMDPNWRDGLSWFLDFATDVQRSQIGWEKRAKIRELPRHRVELTLTQFFTERQRRVNWLSKIGSKPFMCPLWWTVTRLATITLPATRTLFGDFRRLDYQPQSVILISDGPRTERAVISAAYEDRLVLRDLLRYRHDQQATVTATRIAQVRRGRTFNKLTDGVSEGRLQIDLLEDIAMPAEWFDDPNTDVKTDSILPVMLYPPNYGSRETVATDRIRFELDNDISSVYILEPTGMDEHNFRETYHCRGIAEINRMTKLIWAMAGRYKTFLVPTYTNDFTVSAAYPGSSEWLMVEDNFFTPQLMAEQPISKYIMIRHRRGENYIRQIRLVQPLGDGTTRLLLNEPIPQHTKRDILQICSVWESRLDTDSIEFSYLTDSICTVALTYLAFRNSIFKIDADETILPVFTPTYVIR